MEINKIDVFYPKNQSEWRIWLQANHQERNYIWLLKYKKSSGIESISWSESVDEALCFGWIDSKVISRDDGSTLQYFTKRKPKSTWSKINKDKVKVLCDQGKMTNAGLQCIEVAKQNGSWTFLDAIEALEIPNELIIAFEMKDIEESHFRTLAKSKQKLLLYGYAVAKTKPTKEKRIAEMIIAIRANLDDDK